jgi:Flp pilus assembly protein TadG
MRVRRFSLLRLRDGERGAVAAIVGISLLCLLGMLVLTFDLGRGEALKRNMVNAADAGALAAARECGLAHGPAVAKAAAEQLVGENNGAANVTGFEVNDEAQCAGFPSAGKHQVTVTATVAQHYFFAQIFGFKQGTVAATATAEWTPGIANPVPLKLDQLKVHECNDGHVAGYTGSQCFFTFDNSGGVTGSNRGILDFPEGWPIFGQDSNPMACTSNKGGANDLVNYINQMGIQGSSTFLPQLWDPAPTYACAEGGMNAVLVKAIVDWINKVADLVPKPVVYFPVVACNGGSFPGSGPCYPWITTPGHEAYPVVDFVGMRVVNAWKGQDARNQPNCVFGTGKGSGNGSGSGSSDVFCSQLAVSDPGDVPLAGGVKVRLVG